MTRRLSLEERAEDIARYNYMDEPRRKAALEHLRAVAAEAEQRGREQALEWAVKVLQVRAVEQRNMAAQLTLKPHSPTLVSAATFEEAIRLIRRGPDSGKRGEDA